MKKDANSLKRFSVRSFLLPTVAAPLRIDLAIAVPSFAQTLKVYPQQKQLAPRPLPPATRSEEAQVYSVTQGTPQLVTQGFSRMKEAGEPRAIDATISKVVPRRKRHATIAVVQNARSRATDGIAREFNRKPVVVSGGANRGPLIGSGFRSSPPRKGCALGVCANGGMTGEETDMDDASETMTAVDFREKSWEERQS